MEQVPGFVVEGPVQAEVFVLYLDGGEIRLTGPCGPEAWYIEVAEAEDPMDVVGRLVRSNIGEPRVVHSTSWRRDRDGVILSFVVVVDATLAAGMESTVVGRSELARSRATEAPVSIATDQVLEHGLRHLAWLIRDDEVVAKELADGWPEAVGDYVPQPFRHLS